MAQAARVFDFTKKAGAQGWTAAHDLAEVRPGEEGLEMRISGGDPFLVGPSGNYESREPLVFSARLKSAAEGRGQVFFYKDICREEQSLRFRLRAGWNDVALPLPPLGDGWRLRVDFPGASGDCAVARIGVEAVGERGVASIWAGGLQRRFVRPSDDSVGEKITLHIQPAKAEIAIIELVPPLGYGDFSKAPILWKGTPPESGIVTVARLDGARDRLASGFLAVSAGGPLGTVHYVEDAGSVAPDRRPFREAPNKKGLQYQDVDDALALGVGHATMNVSYGSLIDLENKPENPKWQLDGRTYSFRKSTLDRMPVKRLSDAGVNVYFIFLAYETDHGPVDALVLHPARDAKLPNHMAAANTATEDGARQLRATLQFLTDRYGSHDAENGHLSGFIMGNEVNAHRQWNNFGALPLNVGVEDYARTLRIAHTAVHSISENTRVYCSLEHHWTQRPSPAEYPGKLLLDHLTRLSRMGGDFDWRIAYHPYPENLFEPRFWNDKTALPGSETPKITFKNLEVLPAYLARPEMLYHGHPRTVLLSEQGFHSDNTPAGDAAQAKAFCLAWEKVATLPTVEGFIYHRQVDHGQEGGLNLGLWRRKPESISAPDTKRPIYECFKAAGTAEQARVFDAAKAQ